MLQLEDKGLSKQFIHVRLMSLRIIVILKKLHLITI